MKAITNGTLCTPHQTIKDGVVISDASSISAVDPRARMPIPRDAEIIDAQGRLVVPGLIDLHAYGNLGVSITAPERAAEELSAFARNVARFGVTGFLISPTLGDGAFITRILAALATAIPETRGGAQPLGIHLEGPWLDPEQRGAFPPEWLHAPSIDEAREYVRAARGYLRVVTLAPNLPNALETARYLRENGVRVSLGHSNATYEGTRDALASGTFSLVTHIFNAMSGLHHRTPGVLGAALSSDEAMAMLICDGIHAHPATVKILLRALGTDRVVLVTDSTPGGGMTEGEFTMLGRPARIVDGVARLGDGTIAGSTLTLNRALMNAREFGGLSLNDALGLATVNPARAVGLSNKGQLVVGGDADVVVMDDAGHVALTMVRGEVVFRNPKIVA